MTRMPWHAGAMIVVAMMLTACGSAPPAPEDHYYRLITPEVGRAAAPTLDSTLIVKRFAADGILDQRAIAFANASAPQALKHYNYHFWSDPPTHLVQDYAVMYLRRAGVAPQVVPIEVGVDGGYELLGRVRRFEHLREGQESVAVTLELGLLRVDDATLLMLKDYSATRATNGTSPAFAVRALNAALNDVMARFTADIATLN